MPLQLHWLGDEHLDRIADVRMRCYAHAAKERERYRFGIRADSRARPGDFLIAEQGGVDVGTATALSLQMWVRGGRVPCQGVAYVGTIKTHRRADPKTVRGGGIASQIMRETLRMGREREQVVSALMPFCASFYDHFGYGLVETRNVWTIPLSILPAGPFDGIRFVRNEDIAELERCRQAVVEAGQCDIERSAQTWADHLQRAEEGLLVVDRPSDEAGIRGWVYFQHTHEHGRDLLRIIESGHSDIEALSRQIRFLASLRDQYASVTWPLPADLPLNWLLREPQLPHRPVNHRVPELRPETRVQLRVLDHKRLIETMKFPEFAKGSVVVEVLECEGETNRFKIDVSGGRASVSPSTAPADLTCPDRVWSAIVTGEMPAETAIQLGLAAGSKSASMDAIAIFSQGPRPFTTEYF